MTITHAKSGEQRTCFRCLSIGLPPLGIQAEEPHMEITVGSNTSYACTDCYDRLREAIQDSEADEPPGT